MLHDVYLSHAAPDLGAALDLTARLEALQQGVRRPLALDAAAAASAQPLPPVSGCRLMLVLLSVAWLRSPLGPRHWAAARSAGVPVRVLVHPDLPRLPQDGVGRGRRAQLEEVLAGHPLAAELLATPWWWLGEPGDAAPHWALLPQVLASTADALPVAEPPPLAPAQGEPPRAGLASRLAMLYGGAQARATAYQARDRARGEPALALALAAAAADLADTPASRSTLLTLLGQQTALRRVMPLHAPGRRVQALAFSPDGRWLATGDARQGPGDDGPARLCLVDLHTLQQREGSQSRSGSIGALAWGRPWLAVGTRGGVGWLRWDEASQRFGARSPTPLSEPVTPAWMSWSGVQWAGGDDWLAWGCPEGLLGLARPGEARAHELRLPQAGRPDALQGLAWVAPGQVLTLESNRVCLRPFPALEPVVTLGAMDRFFHLWAQGGHWVVTGVQRGRTGVLRGFGAEVWSFEPHAASGPFQAADLGQRTGEPNWVISVPGRKGHDVPALAVGPDLARLHYLLPSLATPAAGLAVDAPRRRVAVGDGRTGAVSIWQLGEPHPLLHPLMPAGVVRAVAAGPGHAMMWVDLSSAFHRDLMDGGERPDRLSAGFAVVRLLPLDGGREVLMLGEKGESAVFDLASGQRRQPLWPRPPGREGLHLVATAAQAPRVAMVDPDGVLWLLEARDGHWQPLAHWEVIGQPLAITLSPRGEEIHVMVAQGFVRVGRWRMDDPGSPHWSVVLSQGLPGPMAVEAGGALLVGDGEDLVWQAAGQDSGDTLRLSGHAAPVRAVALTQDLLLSVSAAEQQPELDELRLWSTSGLALGVVPLPDRLASLGVTRSGQQAWLLMRGGELFRLPLDTAAWARIAQFVAGRPLTAAERQQHGLLDAGQLAPSPPGPA
ncbi:hypothetical protein [Ideonella livida]|uniref:TIR domain-containing protein n=1 Tax=Ideonella livida TaxID=2707176 RepID=A0A7C9PKV1_9BURK|nr:hypothetical protein [Ideonella livida]NDY93852.1 hypothetical protein [Ideonella livida]